MADLPVEVVAPVATLAVGAIGTLFGLLIKSKSSEAKAWKAAWKDAVASRRNIRREIEAAELGAPSVPPTADEDYDDRTGRYEAVADEDRNWRPSKPTRIEPGLPEGPPLAAFEDRLSREDREKLARQRTLRKYVSDGDSTPPEGPRARRR